MVKDMKTKKEFTKVIFRKFSNGEIIALFPELPGNNNPSTCLNYMHIGQHGSGLADLSNTQRCTKLESHNLYMELVLAVGYSLHVISRISAKMHQKRIAALQKI